MNKLQINLHKSGNQASLGDILPETVLFIMIALMAKVYNGQNVENVHIIYVYAKI